MGRSVLGKIAVLGILIRERSLAQTLTVRERLAALYEASTELGLLEPSGPKSGRFRFG